MERKEKIRALAALAIKIENSLSDCGFPLVKICYSYLPPSLHKYANSVSPFGAHAAQPPSNLKTARRHHCAKTPF